ncbi:unnamed protein product [Callosobruchus maculatus]|uniref:Uncharacterized protein n=1 Tax=Callosobruchus maculatus TaxID=64391 RepID=A0A653DTB3_CALMS|nr:unnamed protein product [Callosobruchus maculatus]
MDRKKRILMMARGETDNLNENEAICNNLPNKSNVPEKPATVRQYAPQGDDILWNIPPYESTLGIERSEIDILLSNSEKLFVGELGPQCSPDRNKKIQIQEISSTEKSYDSTNRKRQIRQLSLESHSEDEPEDNEDDEDYIPHDSDEHCESEDDEKEESEDAFDSGNCIPIPECDVNQTEVRAATNKTKTRTWDKKDFCFYCETEVLKFSRHILRHHSAEIEVQRILALPAKHKQRKFLFNKLRNNGNFIKSTATDNIVPVRKPICGSADGPSVSTYLPCKYCKGFYKKKWLFRHVAVCPFNDEEHVTRMNAQSEGQSLFATYRGNEILRKDIFPTLRPDAISFTAKTDYLICAVASRYLKSHRGRQYRIVVSRKMRQLASLTIELKKKIKIKNLFDALDPNNFDCIVECTKIISRYDPSTDSFGAPSLASQMGTELKDCIDVAYNMTLKNSQKECEKTIKLKTLKELIVSEWRYEISTTANNDLKQKKWNKPSLIPLAEDLTLLKKYLLDQSEDCKKILLNHPTDEKAFRTLTELTFVQLLLLNRRRVGELQRMTLSSYVSNINNKPSDEFLNCISESEKRLMRAFKLVVIKGKRGRGVPVLFTQAMESNVNLMIKLRENLLIHENIFLFPNITTTQSIDGSKAIYKHVRLAGVKNPAALTSTKLRKHLATMSQVINLSEQDLEQLAIFMGHTSDIHKTHYRLPSDVYQMAKVSKLLLLNEKGEASKYKGKSLDDIDIDLDVIEDGESSDEEDGTLGNNKELIASAPSTATCVSEDQNTAPIVPSMIKKKRENQPWTEEQKRVTLKFFKYNLDKKIPPKKHECLQLQEQHPDLLGNKAWVKIKIFVVNTYNKQK